METTLETLQLMGGRLCHDLATPLGALSLGLEMLADQKLTPEQSETMSLIQQSLDATKKRLELFRFLLGYGQTEDLPLMSEILKLLKAYWQDSRLTLHTEGISHLKGTPARFVLALMVTASEQLPRGGELIAQLNEPTFSVVLNGTGAEISAETAQIFARQPALLTPRNVWAWYTHCLAERLRLSIEVCQAPLGFVCRQL